MKPNILSTIVITLALAGVMYWYSGSSSDIEPSLTTTSVSSPTQARFRALGNKLGAADFDISIFSNPTFAGLQPLTTTIIPEDLGRLDPFAPILLSGTIAR